MQRRTFLIASGLAGTSLAMAQPPHVEAAPDPAAMVVHAVESVLDETIPEVPPEDHAELHRRIQQAWSDFHTCRYARLSSRIPQLVATAEATSRTSTTPAVTQTLLARTWSLVTRVLFKLQSSGLEWRTATLALHAARRGDDPLTVAESQRLVASVYRRAGDCRRATEQILDAATKIDTTGTASPQALGVYGQLLCTASYSSARSGNAGDTAAVLDEVETIVERLARFPQQQRALASTLASHRLSASIELGNPGDALRLANNPPAFAAPERRGRWEVDVALAEHQAGRYDAAFRRLLAADQLVPGEVRTRVTVRRLAADLVHRNLPGVRAFAARTHALA